MIHATSAHDTYVDLLIICARARGPDGQFVPVEMGIHHRIIDKLGTRALNGRADGFSVCTVEIWESFGIGNRLREYSIHFAEWAL